MNDRVLTLSIEIVLYKFNFITIFWQLRHSFSDIQFAGHHICYESGSVLLEQFDLPPSPSDSNINIDSNLVKIFNDSNLFSQWGDTKKQRT